MHHSTQNKDDEAVSLAGVSASSLVRRSRDPVILVFSQRPAARCVLADAMEPDEGFESLGSIAVRLLAEWKLPKMILASSGRTDDASAR